MDPRLNPFVVKPGVRPPQLLGRDAVLKSFDAVLYRLAVGRPATAPFITGPRGIGKTVLLNELVNMARVRGWYVAAEEVDRKASFPDLIAVMAHDVLLEMSKERRIRERVKRVFGLLKAFTSVSALGISLQIDAQKVGGADTGLFDRDVRKLLIEIGSLAQEQRRGVLLAFDEIHVLEESAMDVLHAAMHVLGQLQLPVALLGAGLFPSWQSGKETWDPLRISTYPARQYTSSYVRLEPFPEAVSEATLVATTRSQGADMPAEVARTLARFCEGNPWILQMVGSLVWDTSPGPIITRESAMRAMAEADRNLADYFFPRLIRNLPDEELRLLSVLADMDRYPASLADFVAACGFEAPTGDFEGGKHSRRWSPLEAARPLFRELTPLKMKDLVVTRDTILGARGFSGEVAFSVPRLREYLRARRF